MAELTREDEARVIAAAKADPREFGALYEAHFTRIFRYLLARLRDADRAEDLTQQTFLRALRGIGRYRDRGAPYAAYLYRIAHNLLINSYRRPPATQLDHAPDLTAREANDPDAAIIWREVAQLPSDAQNTISLRFREGYSIPMIARAIGKSESAAKMIISRALAAIRAKLV